jgi:hypothetical protein
MNNEKLFYIPKGSMCQVCINSHNDCQLDFSSMPIYKQYTDKVVQVICTAFIKRQS